MNTQPKIKSCCQELLKEQEMSSRKIRKLISKAAFTMGDPTRCLKPWGWTFGPSKHYTYWSKIFTLPYPLLATQNGLPYLRQEVIIVLNFSNCHSDVDLWIRSCPESGIVHNSYSSYNAFLPKSKLRTSLILQKIAIELPKAISSLRTESFYDETKQKQIEVIPVSELRSKIGQVFKKAHETFGGKTL